MRGRVISGTSCWLKVKKLLLHAHTQTQTAISRSICAYVLVAYIKIKVFCLSFTILSHAGRPVSFYMQNKPTFEHCLRSQCKLISGGVAGGRTKCGRNRRAFLSEKMMKILMANCIEHQYRAALGCFPGSNPPLNSLNFSTLTIQMSSVA